MGRMMLNVELKFYFEILLKSIRINILKKERDFYEINEIGF